ncbi:MAG: hypothetical protein FWG65_12870 [Turicibacter sp.]|nr:hypothetical protein [Turicibacter sp.]
MKFWIIDGVKHESLAVAETTILEKLGLPKFIGKATFLDRKKLNKELKNALLATEYIFDFYGVEIKCYMSEE